MKLDRNINGNGRGKYALLKLRKLDEFSDGPFQELAPPILEAMRTLERAGILDWGNTPETEFFLIRLRDKNASHALHGYAAAALRDDLEFAHEVTALALRSGANHPNCKQPD